MNATAKIKLLTAALALALSAGARAADPGVVVDIFKEISAGVQAADVAKIAERFDSRVELRLPATEKTCSTAEAAALVQAFFEQHKPTSYATLHVGGKGNKHYGIGLLNTAEGRFRLTIFLLVQEKSYTIQQLRIEHEK